MRGPRGWVAAAAAWALVIVVFGVVPTHETLQATVGSWENAVASALHFAEYAALAFLLAVAIAGWRVTARGLVWAALVAVTLGWAVEVVQLPLSYRDFQAADGIVDMAGAAVGLAVFTGVAAQRAARRPEHRG
jgi:VanZ family protein